jgi:hypothetical protein
MSIPCSRRSGHIIRVAIYAVSGASEECVLALSSRSVHCCVLEQLLGLRSELSLLLRNLT